MFSETARYYDFIYSFKDYEEEASQITALIRREHPIAKSILDVACGTAEHLRYLAKEFEVDGLDLEPEFIEIAKSKNPKSNFFLGDMTAFSLGRKYDVVQCLFSSIGYINSCSNIVAALNCFKKHLRPNGVLFIEPWFTPDVWKTGAPHMVTVDKPELKICRMNVSDRIGNVTPLKFKYLIGDSRGVRYVEETHELTLYTVDEMLKCFSDAGLSVEHDPKGIFGRGMYTARVKSENV